MITHKSVGLGTMSRAEMRVTDRLSHDPVAVLKDRGINAPAGLPLSVAYEFARVVSFLWVDGQTVPLDEFRIDPSDEGLLFGRGVWESTRTVGGDPWLWPLHLERLMGTAELLGIAVTPGRLPGTAEVGEYVRSLTSQDVVVRLNVTAGAPGKVGVVWMSAAPQPQPPASIRLRTMPNPVQKGNPYLTLKTFQYATRLRIGQQAGRDGFDTALLTDADGNLLEAAHANLFVRLRDGWATPPADGGLLPGTVRHHLLTGQPVPIRECRIPCARLSEVQEAFVTNSNVGIVPVTQIDGHALSIGTDTLNLMRWLQPPPTPGVIQYRFVDRGGVSR